MAKMKTKRKPVRRKVKPVRLIEMETLTIVPVEPAEAVLVVVPIEKTKDTTWQQFVAWIRG